MNNRSMEGKKILILGGAFQHCKVVEAAKALGMTTYVTSYDQNEPAGNLADVRLTYDVKDVDAIVRFCRKERIDGVINVSLDPCQIPYQRICASLDLPCFGDERQFYCLTNKQAFKQLCATYGVDTILSYTREDVENAENADKVEYPIIVKPADSRGSRGQKVCYDRAEAMTAILEAAAESSTGEVILEKCMMGCDDFAVAYLVVRGEPFLVRACDRHTGPASEGMDRVAVMAGSPSKHMEMYLEHVHQRVICMLKGLGIVNGPVFFQGFVSGDTVMFYDPGMRFSGGEYERLLQRATGIDLVSPLVCFAVTGDMGNVSISEDTPFMQGKRTMQFDPLLRPGKIARIEGCEEIIAQKGIVTFNARYSVGETVPDRNDVSRRFAEIGMVADTSEEEMALIRFVQQRLHILDTEGKEMVCAPFAPR